MYHVLSHHSQLQYNKIIYFHQESLLQIQQKIKAKTSCIFCCFLYFFLHEVLFGHFLQVLKLRFVITVWILTRFTNVCNRCYMVLLYCSAHVRIPKWNSVEHGRYLGEWPPGNTILLLTPCECHISARNISGMERWSLGVTEISHLCPSLLLRIKTVTISLSLV